jgi:hypothetical protein
MGISDANHSYFYGSNAHRQPRPIAVMLEHNLASLSSCSLPPSPASTPTNSTHSVKKRKTASRSVSFGNTDSLTNIESTGDLSEGEKGCRWYQAIELQEIKSAARRLCLQGGIRDEEDSTRGMDVYYPSRQRNNRKFVEHVLEAYHFRYAGNPDHVRQLVERWSAKSKQRAIMRAKQDYHEAYPTPRECCLSEGHYKQHNFSS